MASFSRLIRFLGHDDNVYYGDAIIPEGTDDIGKTTQAHIIHGNIFGEHKVTDRVVGVKKLLAPLARSDIRTVRCLGLNYEEHAKETNMPLPEIPALFYKPVTAITGPFDDIPVSATAQQGSGMDYECELVVVVRKEALNVSESEALDYVLGYTVGNDVSNREWQMRKGGGQWSYGKGFDGWGPIGPGIVSPRLVDSGNLRIHTKVNGEIVQSSSTNDMGFNVAKTIALLSGGTTLLPGDVIFTGTPPGVGAGRNPPLWLKNGDIVEVGLEGVGNCVNKVVFAKTT